MLNGSFFSACRRQASCLPVPSWPRRETIAETVRDTYRTRFATALAERMADRVKKRADLRLESSALARRQPVAARGAAGTLRPEPSNITAALSRRELLGALGALGLGAAAGLPAGCRRGPQPEPRPTPRLVLLYSPCTVNKNYLSPYDPRIGFTPHLDHFAADSLLFERHSTEAPSSGIAYASLFTGRHADQHGICSHPRRLGDDVYQVFQAFAEQGYDTWYFQQHPMANYQLNYGQGVPEERAPKALLAANNGRFRQILERLVADPFYKVFISTSFTRTHFPYPPADHRQLPEEFLRLGMSVEEFSQVVELWRGLIDSGRFSNFELSAELERTLAAERYPVQDLERLSQVLEYFYKVRIHYLDQLFGDLVAVVDQAVQPSESLIAFTADHGEVLYRKSLFFSFTHGWELAPEEVSVPWIVRAPGLGVRPGRYGGVTRSIDVFPTLCALSGFEVPADRGLQGVSLAAAARGEVPAPDLLAFHHSGFQNSKSPKTFFGRFYPRRDPELMWVSLRDGDWVFKIGKFDAEDPQFAPAVFDLATDPTESVNLYDAANPLHRRRLQQLVVYKKRLVEACRIWENMDPGIAREESDSRLKALGYL